MKSFAWLLENITNLESKLNHSLICVGCNMAHGILSEKYNSFSSI